MKNSKEDNVVKQHLIIENNAHGARSYVQLHLVVDSNGLISDLYLLPELVWHMPMTG